MDSKKFIKLCIDEVVKYTNEHLDKTDKKQITKDDVFVVWSCKTLQNNKALLSTNIFDGIIMNAHITVIRMSSILMPIKNGKIDALN